MRAGAWGLEMIALCTAGDIIMLIACGRADLFSVPMTVMQRGLLLHTPTFSARLGADGLETFSFFFYLAMLFQGQRLAIRVQKSKATVYWLQRIFITITDTYRWCEVTLLRWLLLKYEKNIHQHCFIRTKSFYVVVEEKRGKRGNRWRQSTSLLKSLITAEGNAVITQNERSRDKKVPWQWTVTLHLWVMDNS